MSSDNWMAPEEFAEAARQQREWLNDMAEKIEAGEALETRLDRKLAAGVLRAWAKQIPDTQPRGRGRPPQFNSRQAAWEFSLLVNVYDYSENKAHEAVAGMFGVDPESIRKSIKKNHPDARGWLPRNPNLKPE